MIRLGSCCLIILLLFSNLNLWAQIHLPVREKAISLTSDTIKLDTLSIISSTFSLTINDTTTVQKSDYFLDFSSSKFVVLNKSLLGQTGYLSYRVFPYNFAHVVKHADLPPPEKVFSEGIELKLKPTQEDIFGEDQLNRQGTWTRGITFGNNQNLVLNSGLDLRLFGKIGDNVSIEAAMTDKNIPFQPDGTTAQLREFDKVFFHFKMPKQDILLGDFQLSNPLGSHFLKYNKKAAGINTYTWQKFKGRDSSVSGVAFSVSRGKWKRQLFNGVAGLQGPYRLDGNDNELFVTVLSGTEKVFLNGILLKRGEFLDYTIDYNNGEISFTNNHIINSHDRVVVEFQYADQNYKRTINTGFSEYYTGKWKLGVAAFSEQDHKNQPIYSLLDTSDLKILSEAGDNISNIYTSSADSTGFNSDAIRYKKIDSAGVMVYKFSVNPDSAFYSVYFTFVGSGAGDYRYDKSIASGKIFVYVGEGKGDHLPVVKLIAPQQNQMIVMNAAFKSSTTSFNMEGAVSGNDPNKFSEVRKEHTGIGFSIDANHLFHFSKSRESWSLLVGGNSEIKTAAFRPVERYRSVEFERTYNQTDGNPAVKDVNKSEFIGGVYSTIKKKDIFSMRYGFNLFQQEAYLKSIQNQVSGSYNIKKFSVASLANLSSNNTVGRTNRKSFLNHNSSITYLEKKWHTGINFNGENGYDHNGKSFIPDSFSSNFYEPVVFISSGDSSINNWLLEARRRTDVFLGKPAANLSTYSIRYNWNGNELRSGAMGFKFQKHDSLLTKISENNFLANGEYYLSAFRKAIQSEAYYETGTGRQLERDIAYVKVEKGQGYYKWIDNNSDGIAQLDEFFVAVFKDEGEYYRVFIPSSKYVNTINNQLRQSIRFTPSKLFSKTNLLCRINTLTTLQTNRKWQASPKLVYINPYTFGKPDSTLVSSSTQFKNIFYFNQSSSVWGFELNQGYVETKILLTNGFEELLRNEYKMQFRINFGRYITLQPFVASGYKRNSSDYTSSRNYLINFTKWKAEISIQPSNQLRISGSYLFEDNANQINNMESSIQKTQSTGVTYSTNKTGSVNFEFSHIYIHYIGGANSPVSYELLQGLQPGNNYIWSFNWGNQVSENMRLSFIYNARKCEGQKTIHTGSAQVMYLF